MKGFPYMFQFSDGKMSSELNLKCVEAISAFA